MSKKAAKALGAEVEESRRGDAGSSQLTGGGRCEVGMQTYATKTKIIEAE